MSVQLSVKYVFIQGVTRANLVPSITLQGSSLPVLSYMFDKRFIHSFIIWSIIQTNTFSLDVMNTLMFKLHNLICKPTKWHLLLIVYLSSNHMLILSHSNENN